MGPTVTGQVPPISVIPRQPTIYEKCNEILIQKRPTVAGSNIIKKDMKLLFLKCKTIYNDQSLKSLYTN